MTTPAPTPRQGEKVRSHVCTFCDSAFTRAEHLRRHVLSHENRKTHKCKICNMKYGRADVLKRHMRKCTRDHERRSGFSSGQGTDPIGKESRRPVEVTGSESHKHEASQRSSGHDNNPMPSSINETNYNSFLPSPTSLPPSSHVEVIQSSQSSYLIDRNHETDLQSTYDVSENFMFLEEALLPEFNYNSMDFLADIYPEEPLNITISPQSCEIRDQYRELDLTSISQNDTMRVDTDPNGNKELRISTEDVNSFEENLMCSDTSNRLADFCFPSRWRILRLLTAYFDYFDPHTPIIHRASFNLSENSPALVLAMLAIGGLHVHEHEFAKKAYEACNVLLAEHEIERASGQKQPFAIWPIQTAVLCAQFGAFSDDEVESHRSQRQFSFIATMLREGHDQVSKVQRLPILTWSDWIFLETFSRVTTWTVILCSVILSFDSAAVCMVAHQPVDLPLPCDQNIWYTQSAHEWQRARGHSFQQTGIGLWTATKMLLQGENLSVDLSPYGLLALIGAISSYICSHERLSMGSGDNAKNSFTHQLEHTLNLWEELWRKHPQAEQVPSRQGDPLMSDCFSILGSAYYHLWTGSELQTLKQFTKEPSIFPRLPDFRASPTALKAVKYAANSWSVRSKLGISHLEKTGALVFGGHTLVTAFEGVLLLAWWLYTTDVETPLESTRNEQERVLDRLIREIFEELTDQGIEIAQKPRSAILIDCYQRLTSPWVWTYANMVSQDLSTFSDKLNVLAINV